MRSSTGNTDQEAKLRRSRLKPSSYLGYSQRVHLSVKIDYLKPTARNRENN